MVGHPPSLDACTVQILTQGAGGEKSPEVYIWMFPKIGVPQNGWFIMENPIKMDDLGVPVFLETPIYSPINQIRGHLSRKIPTIPGIQFYSMLRS